MPVGDVAVRVRKDAVVGGVRHQLHRRAVLGIGAGFGTEVALLQCQHGPVHQFHADPRVTITAHHRSAMIELRVEAPILDRAICCLVVKRNAPCAERTHLGTVPVSRDLPAVAAHNCVAEFVDRVHVAGGVHPSRAVVEALVDEDLSPRHGTIGVQSLLAGHLQFTAEIERRVRVYQEQRVVICCVGRSDGSTVGPARFHIAIHLRQLRYGSVPRVQPCLRRVRPAIKFLQFLQVYAFDVAAD